MLETLQGKFWMALLELGPLMVSLCIAVFYLWKENRELSTYVRSMERENLTTLQDLSNLIGNLVQSTDRTKTDISQKLTDESVKIKDCINYRATIIEERLNRRGKD